MALQRQISAQEKQEILRTQGNRCFIDNHPLDPDGDVEFDHIQPFSRAGESEVANIGAVCKRHNRDKRSLTLSEYRDRLAIRGFFDGAKKRRLDDLLEEKLGPRGYGQPLEVEIADGVAKLYFEGGAAVTPLATCPSTGEEYFFAMMPMANIHNDTELQPRALEEKRVWNLYRHLLRHTQLAPAVCRLVGSDVLLFDGQHKAAAQVWAGRDLLDCKVYLEPDIRRIKETNLAAHDQLRQMPFYTSTLIEKFAALASEDWEAFIEKSQSKTEDAFVDFLRSRSDLTRAEALKRLRSMVYSDIIEHPDNRMRDYIAEENKSRKNPITMSRLQKTFLREFVADPPLHDEFETKAHFRAEEKENVVKFFNVVVEHGLEGRWAPERKDAAHQKAARIFSAGALRAWVPFIRDAIAPSLQLFDQKDRAEVFYRNLSDEDFVMIESLVARLFTHKVWEDPDPDLKDLRYDNADRAKDMLRQAGLTPNWILGGEA